MEGNMGRKKLYITPEEQKERNRAKSKRYYLKNSSQIKEKAMERYYADKPLRDAEMNNPFTIMSATTFFNKG